MWTTLVTQVSWSCHISLATGHSPRLFCISEQVLVSVRSSIEVVHEQTCEIDTLMEPWTGFLS